MKPSIQLLILAAASSGIALGATTAYTTPVGYTSQTLKANTFNLAGINLLKPVVVSSVLTNVVSNVLSDTTQDFSALLTTGKTYIVEISDGPGTADGAVEWFAIWGTTDFTVSNTENIAGAAAGDKYTIRLAPTLQEVFPVAMLNTFGLSSAANADKIWIPQGNGTYIRYAYKTGTNAGWYTTVDGVAVGSLVSGGIPLVTVDGILVERKAADKELVISGEVKKTNSNYYVVPGFNLVSINPPVGLTLFTSGLNGDVATFGLTSANNADKVWIPQGNGTYIRYALKTGTNAGWYTTTDGVAVGSLVTVDFNLPPSILIQRAGGTSKLMTFDVPAVYPSL